MVAGQLCTVASLSSILSVTGKTRPSLLDVDNRVVVYKARDFHGTDVQIQSLFTTNLLPPVVRPTAGLTLPLKKGATGWSVTQLQLALDRHGDSLTADGGFGRATKKAVKAWQTHKGLSANGTVDLDTWLTLG